jgi:hypothetical protein
MTSTDSTSASVNGMSLWPFTRMMQPWPQTGERDGDLDSATHAEGWSIVGRRQIARRNHVSPVLPMTPILGSHALPGTPNHSLEKNYIIEKTAIFADFQSFVQTHCSSTVVGGALHGIQVSCVFTVDLNEDNLIPHD